MLTIDIQLGVKTMSLWDDLNVGDRFIDGNGYKCVKLDDDSYRPDHYNSGVCLYRCYGSDQFDAKKLIVEVENKPIGKAEYVDCPLGLPSTELLAYLERSIIEKFYIRNRYNKSKTAMQLGLSRGTINKKIKQYGLDDKE